jgi:hypothetical protein
MFRLVADLQDAKVGARACFASFEQVGVPSNRNLLREHATATLSKPTISPCPPTMSRGAAQRLDSAVLPITTQTLLREVKPLLLAHHSFLH